MRGKTRLGLTLETWYQNKSQRQTLYTNQALIDSSKKGSRGASMKSLLPSLMAGDPVTLTTTGRQEDCTLVRNTKGAIGLHMTVDHAG